MCFFHEFISQSRTEKKKSSFDSNEVKDPYCNNISFSKEFIINLTCYRLITSIAAGCCGSIGERLSLWPFRFDTFHIEIETYHHGSFRQRYTSWVDNIGIGCDWCEESSTAGSWCMDDTESFVEYFVWKNPGKWNNKISKLWNMF